MQLQPNLQSTMDNNGHSLGQLVVPEAEMGEPVMVCEDNL